MEYVLGIDLGTSGVKAGLINLATLTMDSASLRTYPQDSEQDLELMWTKTVEAVQQAVSQLGGRVNVEAIGLTGQMHGAVLYDAVGKPIGPFINWKDQKWSSNSIIDEMKLAIGDRAFDELGTEMSSGYTGAILFGIKENSPDLFHRIAHFVMLTDFLRGKILGDNHYATDATNAFGTGLFNTRLNCWHEGLILIFQLPPNIFPEVHSAIETAGAISNYVADLVGLRRDIPIIYGGGDNQMSMLGSGLVAPESPMLINIGTAAQLSKVVNKFDRFPGMDTRTFFNGAYAVVAASLGGGSSYQWLRSQIQHLERKDIDYPVMDELAALAPPGADGLFFCTGPSRQNIARRRGFFGNPARQNSISHRARAVMEGVLMDLFESYQILSTADRWEFFVGGGNSLQKSRVWSQIAADLFGKPVRITQSENALLGAALMAAYGLGFIENLDDSAQAIG
jgi:xylulokinase